MRTQQEWFVRWFSSKYYPMLYRDRGENEAQLFVSNLIKKLEPAKDARLLDLACGYGRHSIALHKKGFHVTGLDLSGEAIAEAKKSESPGLNFIVEDMRQFHLESKFDLVLNLFTSFGYFESRDENMQVLDRVKEHLVVGGWFVLDYFNLQWALKHFLVHEEKTIGNVDFTIDKIISEHQAVKTIRVNDGAAQFDFEERVQLFTSDELQTMLIEKGFSVIHIFGNYHLDTFNVNTSDRLIIAARSL